jgi:hypothetical protein
LLSSLADLVFEQVSEQGCLIVAGDLDEIRRQVGTGIGLSFSAERLTGCLHVVKWNGPRRFIDCMV